MSISWTIQLLVWASAQTWEPTWPFLEETTIQCHKKEGSFQELYWFRRSTKFHRQTCRTLARPKLDLNSFAFQVQTESLFCSAQTYWFPDRWNVPDWTFPDPWSRSDRSWWSRVRSKPSLLWVSDTVRLEHLLEPDGQRRTGRARLRGGSPAEPRSSSEGCRGLSAQDGFLCRQPRKKTKNDINFCLIMLTFRCFWTNNWASIWGVL